MNDDLDDRRLGRAVRSALGDVVASAPSSSDPPLRGLELPQPSRRRRPMITLAAGLTAAAGILGIIVLANRDADSPTESEATSPGPVTNDVAAAAASGSTAAPSSTVTSTSTTSTTSAPTTAAPTTSAPLVAIAPTQPGDSPCGSADVPADAAVVQSIHGDIDGDEVDDTVTLYSVRGVWHVNATSSVTGTSSDAVVTLTVDDTATVSFEDIDYSLGAAPKPPVAIMVTGQGPNEEGILANFTFLTFKPSYCVAQWIYRNLDGIDEPFQWVALQEPGHATGMICEGAAGSRLYRLVDSEQNLDGSWRVINRVLTHDFTRAEIELLPEDTIADSPDFAGRYGSIVGCDHEPVDAAAE